MSSSSSVVQKLSVSVFALIALLVVLGLSSLFLIRRLGGQLEMVANDTARQQILAGRIATAASDMTALERGIAFSTALQQPDKVNQYKERYAGVEAAVQKTLEQFQAMPLPAETRTRIERVAAAFAEVRGLHARMLEQLQKQQMDMALSLLDQLLIPKLQQTSEISKKLVNEQSAQLDKVVASTGQIRSFSILLTLVLLVVGAAMGVVVAGVVRSTVRRLRTITAELAAVAGQVAGGARQISAASQQLADGASRQAGSLEETSASSQEMTSMTQRNAENTRRATELMAQVDANIHEANQNLEAMNESMAEITGSSEKIARIIKIIDEISFQTNILALNAAVEAARAGEAGMGFAVVAEEVRNLAQRSAQAARDTAALIEDSIRTSGMGSDKLALLAQGIKQITGSAQQVKSLVEEISAASQEQARGIDHIARSVTQIEQVTQQAAASAEQSASASETMLSQAQVLDEMVRQLIVLVGVGREQSHAQPVTL